jgi:hypothetical protein
VRHRPQVTRPLPPTFLRQARPARRQLRAAPRPIRSLRGTVEGRATCRIRPDPLTARLWKRRLRRQQGRSSPKARSRQRETRAQARRPLGATPHRDRPRTPVPRCPRRTRARSPRPRRPTGQATDGRWLPGQVGSRQLSWVEASARARRRSSSRPTRFHPVDRLWSHNDATRRRPGQAAPRRWGAVACCLHRPALSARRMPRQSRPSPPRRRPTDLGTGGPGCRAP